MHRLIAAALAAASCATIAQAQTAPPVEAGATLSLDQALSMAGATAPSLDAAEADIRTAQAARTVAGLRPNPGITVEAENVAGSGIYRGTENLEATTTFALPIELGGKRSARIGVADARSKRTLIQAAITQADLRLSVIQAYAEAAAAEQRLLTARDQARIAAEGLRAAEVRVQAGRASPIEVQRADVARINADAEVERTQRLVEVARYSLSRIIGAPTVGNLDAGWFARVQSAYGPMQDIESAGTLAMAAADADLAVADAGVRLARAQRVPDLTVGAGARYIRETGDTAALFSLSIPLPLFNNGRAALAQASSERVRADAQRRVTALEVDQAIARAQADAANAATTAATASGPALRASEEAARIARIGYREGKFGQLELLDAERTLSETRRAAIDALLNYHSALAQLERLTVRAPDLQGN
ncbi:TolC family protein [Sphingomonas sp. C8-2]|jgi:cobalt-zinc-cadmium efflux system outer membrane protein|uniref:TolC family protein n=1 Tax=Sphingomonas sp. KC8 TaxID=1030157 RepID=UPI000248985B|nr:TolC family protein [Sphingomonas sp. KC8]ARS26421.1 heavy metal efflux system protein [Sphingomonas sp. KC8]QEH78399.1 TolC family protein [Sphingomonas sp. C8-2]